MPDSYGTVMGEPDMISAGDFIRFMRTAGEIGMNLISGSTGIVPKPGFVYIGERLAEKSNETGGTIMTGQNYVEKVMPPYHRQEAVIQATPAEGRKPWPSNWKT